jgi:phenylalanyl-tRNA synthetase alpha chain
MSQYQTLETSIMDEIAASADEAAIEAVRVAALGKKGSVSELLKGLGKMTPEERQQAGPAINGLRDRVTEAITARKTELATPPSMRGWRPKPSMSPCRCALACRARPHPPDHPGRPTR